MMMFTDAVMPVPVYVCRNIIGWFESTLMCYGKIMVPSWHLWRKGDNEQI